MRTGGEWPSDNKRTKLPRGFPWDSETPWLEEHGALFKFDDVGVRHFDTFADGERWFKAEHGDCQVCDGTGFELFERGRYEFARRCPRLPELKSRATNTRRPGGFSQP